MFLGGIKSFKEHDSGIVGKKQNRANQKRGISGLTCERFFKAICDWSGNVPVFCLCCDIFEMLDEVVGGRASLLINTDV